MDFVLVVFPNSRNQWTSSEHINQWNHIENTLEFHWKNNINETTFIFQIQKLNGSLLNKTMELH